MDVQSPDQPDNLDHSAVFEQSDKFYKVLRQKLHPHEPQFALLNRQKYRQSVHRCPFVVRHSHELQRYRNMVD